MTKKIVLFLAFLCPLAVAGTTTLTGTIKDSQGNPLNGRLVMWLPVPAQDPSTQTGIMPTPVYFKVYNGVITGGAPLFDVNTINPLGLYYVARAYDTAGNLVFYGNYAVTGGSFNLGQAVPTSVTTSNISYLSPGFTNGNNTWTGTNVFTLGLTVDVSGTGCTKALNLINVDVAPTNPNKYFRINQATGALEFMSNGCSLIASLTDAGSLTIPGTITASSGASIGGGGPLTCDTSFCSATNAALTTPAINGVTISGTPAAGQTLVATSPSAASWSSSTTPIQAASVTTATGTSIGASNTTWVTKAVTMPSSGCPCRAFVSYGVYFTSGGSGTATFWVEDGTNTFATSRTLTNTAGGNAAGSSASAFSPVTYANNATITFIGRGYTDAAGSITTATPPFGSSQNPWLNIVIIPSL